PAHQRGVTLAYFRGAFGPGFRALDHESALGADRHDHRVLHHLRLHETEDLGAEVVGSVAPTDATPGDLAAAQMQPLHARAVDVDFVERAGPGEEFDPLRMNLDR